MAARYEYYITGDDGQDYFFSTAWPAQTFTPSASHTLTSIKVKVFKFGNPGTVDVFIRATSGGHPVLPNLATGSFNANLLGGSPGAFITVTMTGSPNLSSGVQYALILHPQGGDGSNNVAWRRDESSPSYAGGCQEYSATGLDGSWTTNTANDWMFEEWGDPPIDPPEGTTDAASSIEEEQAVLNGTLTDDGGAASDCGFEWGPTTDYGNTTSTESKTTGQTFAQTITGLRPGAVYHFRAKMTNGAGTVYGDDAEFTTLSPATLRQHYNTGDDDTDYFFGDTWTAQSFTIAVSHKLTKVELKLNKFGSPSGDNAIYIRAVDGDGKPTGVNLATGSIAFSSLDTTPTWYEILMTPANMYAGRKYAVIINSGGDAANNIGWRRDGTSPSYTGGDQVVSVDAGINWDVNETNDMMFEEYGTPLGPKTRLPLEMMVPL